MPLIERKSQLATLSSALGQAKAGRPTLAVVRGPVACGRTALLRTFLDNLAEPTVVLRANARTAERGVALGVLGQLLHTTALAPDRRDALLADLAGSAGPAVDPAVELRIAGAVLDLAADTPVLIVIDDANHTDAASLRYLLHLSRRLVGARVLIVLGESGQPWPAIAADYTTFTRQLNCHVVHVGPLSEAGVAELTPAAASWFAATGGNPLLVNALASTAPTDDNRTALRAAMTELLHTCDEDVKAVAHAVAVLGKESTVPRLADVLGLHQSEVDTQVRALTAAGLLVREQFREPALRDATLADVPDPTASRLHEAAARRLHADGTAPEVIGEHLFAASRPEGRLANTAPWMIQVLEAAAEQAWLAGDRSTAVTMLELAHAWCAEPAGKAALLAALTGAAWLQSPAMAGRHLPALRDAALTDQLPVMFRSTLVSQLLWHGRQDDAVELINHWEREPGEDGDDQAARLVRLKVSATHPPLLARLAPGGPPAPAVSVGAVPVDTRLQAATVLSAVLARGASPATVTQAEQVLQRVRLREHEPSALESALDALLALLYGERLDLAEPACDRLLAEPDERVAPTWRAQLLSVRAELSLRRGALKQAAEQARAAFDLLPAAGWGTAVGFPMSTLIIANTRMGRHEEAAAALRTRVPDALMRSRYGLHYLHARGIHQLATDQVFAALADFMSCGELMRSWGVDLPTLVPWRASAASAWLRLGNGDAARKLVSEQLARHGGDRGRALGIVLRQLAAVSEPPQRVSILTEAMEILDAAGDRYELAATLADLGKAQQVLGAFSRARMAARRAWHAALDCDAIPLSNTVRPALAGEDVDDADLTGVAALSEAERRVAALAAQGYTNREISSKLFITISTVEQHLTRSYRKLGVRQRTELPASLYAEVV
ncbi:helix-turn-helix transcriptional regulator [Actinophytocola sp.]|uniref:helix-turn-helix transcriptional regulator n=1 Tax=Actinophytocola sp. TaxID=1872138 RepID=UPI002D312C29|nr:AAA family ATPase [Actinophytocola sp.]HYQ63329.1 AAA family ATPase [Actinophytocola sp.]